MDDDLVLNARLSSGAYSKEPQVDGWSIDPDLSSDDYTTYTKDGKAIVSYRGTDLKGKNWARDLSTDLLVGAGLQDLSNRMKKARIVAEKAQQKYGSDNLTTTGHSLGATQSAYVNRKLKIPGVAFNTGSTPVDLLTRRKYTKGLKNITAEGDIISQFSGSNRATNIKVKPKVKNSHSLINFL